LQQINNFKQAMVQENKEYLFCKLKSETQVKSCTLIAQFWYLKKYYIQTA